MTSVTTGIAVPDPVAIVNAGYRWEPRLVGVALTDGVGEIELASVFDTQAWSLATRTLAVTTDGRPVRSRHGLTFVPRADLAHAAPELDRLLVPGTAAVADLARSTDLALDSGTWPWVPTPVPVVLALRSALLFLQIRNLFDNDLALPIRKELHSFILITATSRPTSCRRSPGLS
jgi:hypothetical protein